ncbi:hypothetical protein ACLOJK_011271 [Asimina triloba]
MEVSLTKDPRVVIVEVDDDNMLEVEDALPLRAVIPTTTGLLRLKGALEASKPSLKVISLEATLAKGPKAKDVPTKGPTVQSPKKMAWAHEKEHVKDGAKASESKIAFATDQIIEEKRS